MGHCSDSDRGRRFIIYHRVRCISGKYPKLLETSFSNERRNDKYYLQLVNRQNGSKLKPTMSAIYEEEVAKHTSSHRSSDYSKPVHTIWTDPDVSWNDKSFESTSNKVDLIN